MKHEKANSRVHPTTYFTLLVSVGLVALGGTRFAMLKNEQIQVARQCDAIERRIEQYYLDVRTIGMNSESLLNRFVIRDKLAKQGTALQPIPAGYPEEIVPQSAATASLP